jgi:hypothetical protein
MSAFNRQEAFDKAYRGIVKQGGPAYGNGSCMYRAPDGNKCAIGQLMPEDAEPRLWDLSGSIDGHASRPIAALLGIGEADMGFADDLQAAHDRRARQGLDAGEYLGFFRHYMRGLAEAYDLNPAVLDEQPA